MYRFTITLTDGTVKTVEADSFSGAVASLLPGDPSDIVSVVRMPSAPTRYAAVGMSELRSQDEKVTAQSETMINIDEILNNTFDEALDLRIERCIWLFGMGQSGVLSSDMVDALCGEPDEIANLFGLDEEDVDDDNFAQFISDHNKNGFLVQAATPIPTFKGDGSSCSYSWGWYTTKWFYADWPQELALEVVKWAKDVYEGERAKYLAAQEPTP